MDVEREVAGYALDAQKEVGKLEGCVFKSVLGADRSSFGSLRAGRAAQSLRYSTTPMKHMKLKSPDPAVSGHNERLFSERPLGHL